MDDTYEHSTDDKDFVELVRLVDNRRASKRYMERRDNLNMSFLSTSLRNIRLHFLTKSQTI